ncbi:50S ribosomal protein L19 [candidate division WWE3 bacterium]|nr:50S ribosomal protein L19 [candidate division WWE3 bacterium]
MTDTITQEKTQDNPGIVSQNALPKTSEFNVGDTVKVNYKIKEGESFRIQPFEGIVIAKKNAGISKTFTVRRIGNDGIGVERIFPKFSPNIESVAVVKRGAVRRAKLYYLRDKIGRAALKIKEPKDLTK